MVSRHVIVLSLLAAAAPTTLWAQHLPSRERALVVREALAERPFVLPIARSRNATRDARLRGTVVGTLVGAAVGAAAGFAIGSVLTRPANCPDALPAGCIDHGRDRRSNGVILGTVSGATVGAVF